MANILGMCIIVVIVIGASFAVHFLVRKEEKLKDPDKGE